MTPAWWSILGFLLVAAVIVGGTLGAAVIFRVKARKVPPTRALTYECGEEPDGLAWVRFHPRYYVVALMFVVFDVEAAFLLPWALNIKPLGWTAIASMFVFLAVLMLGWLYAVRKGALRWQ